MGQRAFGKAGRAAGRPRRRGYAPAMAASSERQIRPVREGIFAGDLGDLATLALAGSRCAECGEVQLGPVVICPACGADQLESTSLSRNGRLWTYTVVRNRPPGDFRGPEPFVPMPVGLVELEDGVRVMSPLAAAEDELHIGMSMRLCVSAFYVDDDGVEVLGFAFSPKGKTSP